MKAHNLMTADPYCCSADDSIRDVARAMREHDCGSLPVVESERVVGIVTDRDLALRAVAEGRDESTRVREVMTASPHCCSEDDDVKTIEKVMADTQVRRVPIVNADRRIIGIISQADIARAATDSQTNVSGAEVARTVSRISEPAGH
jgi:CBS domain-containing protein